MTLSDISIKNPVFAWMLMAALIIFGIISYSQLGVSQLPDVDFPVISVNLSWEGAAPEVMETDVVDIVEDSLMSIEGVREISSSIRQGAAAVTIQFEIGRAHV
jgi:multidrug efflux pump